MTPFVPTAYMSSVFSRKKVQSTPSLGMRTGRMLAYRSNSFLIPTLQLSMLGHSSPFSGVVVGAFERDVAVLDRRQYVIGYGL